MPVLVTTLIALGSYAASVLARRGGRRPAGTGNADEPRPDAADAAGGAAAVPANDVVVRRDAA